MKRRNLIATLAAASASAPVAASLAAEEKKDDDLVELLFVQNAAGVTLKDGKLTLTGVSPDTLYFSDRPDRVVGRVTTKDFVEHWASGDDSFKADPPNAVLVVPHDPEPKDIVVVIKDPKLEDGNLVYQVEVLDGDKEASGKSVSLFIDEIGHPATPLSFAGAARREVRQTARRTTRRTVRRRR